MRVSRRGVSVQLMYYSHFFKKFAQYEGSHVGSKTCRLLPSRLVKPCKAAACRTLLFNILQGFSDRATEALHNQVFFLLEFHTAFVFEKWRCEVARKTEAVQRLISLSHYCNET